MAATAGDLRTAALALPQAVEVPHFGTPSFRVNGKIFAQLAVADGSRAILKLPKGRQDLLFEVRPEAFAPAVWGRSVSCYVELAQVAPDELAELVEASWRNVAPKALVRSRPASLPERP